MSSSTSLLLASIWVVPGEPSCRLFRAIWAAAPAQPPRSHAHGEHGIWAVSYTHLTLPTICSV
eukprot:12687969-Alexandrium_andersonii.AAC.1